MTNGFTQQTVEQFGPRGGRKGKTVTSGFSGVITAGVFIFLGYLVLAGVIGWSPQIMWLVIIGFLIWKFS